MNKYHGIQIVGMGKCPPAVGIITIHKNYFTYFLCGQALKIFTGLLKGRFKNYH